MKTTEQYLPVVLIIMLYIAVLTSSIAFANSRSAFCFS